MAQDSQVPAAGNLFDRVAQTPAVQSLAQRLEQGGALSLAGIAAPAQPFLAALLHRLFPNRTILVVTEGLKAQESFEQDLTTWLSKSRIERRESGAGSARQATDLRPATLHPARSWFYPAWDALPHESRLPHADTISERLETLVALADHLEPRVITTSVAALLQKTFAPAELRERTRLLARGEQINPLDLVEWLEDRGYEPEAQVTQKGELALRGGILDVYPLTSPWPVRLEFFGDELESLRHFDPLTQVSREEIASVVLPPAGELGFLQRKRETDRVSAQPPPTATLLDHLPAETLLLLGEPELLRQRAEEYAQQVPPDDPLHTDWETFLGEATAREMTLLELNEAGVEALLDTAPLFSSLDAFRPLAARTPDPQIAEAQRREFFAQMHRWLRQGYTVEVFCNNDGERQRFEEIWQEMTCRDSSLEHPASVNRLTPSTLDRRCSTQLGTLARGFLCDAAKLVVVTDAEIFGRYKVQRPRRLKSPHAAAMRSALEIDFADLEYGDLVVHLQHGIGRYLGLKNLPVGRAGSPLPADGAHEVAQPAGNGTECLVIEYAPGDPAQGPPKLYVPVSQAHLVSKYVGAGRMRPPLNTLGGTRWRKAVEQTERAVRDVAAELLRIQATRESQPGHAYGPDAPWQREFESAFIFEETPDQLTAIVETKSDMERPKPMDRLICGDVGFGKTEVAIRAAFKAVMGGKQVAVLVPTTVLAQQHYNNFRERMADYPIRVELLSRFRTRREQQRVVKDLAAGAVDIVIGTHRLIQEDIAFKDLGLVVIDEEQRFGVLHKEKFKRLRTLVDVLTLSATPIPRTLYLALTGARDMSTIQTPPHDRLPVQTIVTEYDERLIRDAIQRELNRGGQVFFLHNRVMTIQTVQQRLLKLLPQARIVVGHGQMHSDDLEEVMTRFVNGDADVLLSTTIIESGLDIPNANTIIIDRADRFGLSDLYQLRGRVGRYKHQAYAYLLLPRHARLLTDVRKRISAMKQYSTLGSGFKIAMRDLEIRGAGNLLGPEQSGHITAVGFELYCQLLKQSVGALKGEKVKPRLDVRVALDFLEMNAPTASPLERSAAVPSRSASERANVSRNPEGGRIGEPAAAEDSRAPEQRSACLPQPYLPEPQHRIEIYRKLAQATDRATLEQLRKELRDRFGPPPPPVELLLAVAELKILASEKSVSAIEVKENKLMLTRNNEFITLGGKFPRLTKTDADGRVKEIQRILLAL